jgi:hypothetical protein
MANRPPIAPLPNRWRYCPRCRAAQSADAAVCPDCGRALVDALPDLPSEPVSTIRPVDGVVAILAVALHIGAGCLAIGLFYLAIWGITGPRENAAIKAVQWGGFLSWFGALAFLLRATAKRQPSRQLLVPVGWLVGWIAWVILVTDWAASV